MGRGGAGQVDPRDAVGRVALGHVERALAVVGPGQEERTDQPRGDHVAVAGRERDLDHLTRRLLADVRVAQVAAHRHTDGVMQPGGDDGPREARGREVDAEQPAGRGVLHDVGVQAIVIERDLLRCRHARADHVGGRCGAIGVRHLDARQRAAALGDVGEAAVGRQLDVLGLVIAGAEHVICTGRQVDRRQLAAVLDEHEAVSTDLIIAADGAAQA